MKNLVICLAICFILFSAIPAQAGHVVGGNAASPSCDCGSSDGPCYDDATGQRCDNTFLMATVQSADQPTDTASSPTGDASDLDAGSIGLFLLATAVLLRRLMM